MINKLRRKLISVTMISVTLVLIIIFAVTNIYNYYNTAKNADEMLAFIAENNGTVPYMHIEDEDRSKNNLPIQFTEESPYQTRYFIVQYNRLGDIIDINISHIAAITDAGAAYYASEILKSGSESGYKRMYRYLVRETDFGRIVIFLDCSIQLQSVFSMMLASSFIALFCISAIFIVIFVCANRLIRPFFENMEKQKRFVTDAGHELKTPLAIINANVEVLELMNGSNEWLVSIKNQVARMDQLVKNMLQLAKMEENSFVPVYAEFDLSKAFSETAEPFKIMAQQKNRLLKVSVPEGVRFVGDENAIKNLISIFIDNAIKYSDENGTIEAALVRNGKEIIIEVANTSKNIDEKNLGRLFDRFYRPDASRARETGGYGIGLSMASSIVERHKGKISAAKTGENKISFKAVFRSPSLAAKKRLEK